MKIHQHFCHTAMCLLLPCAALGQSSFLFRTYLPQYGIDAHVFDADGRMLVGTNYLAELWGGASSNALSPLDVFGERRREILPLDSNGYILSVTPLLSVMDVLPYGWAWLEWRAWDARLGATYEEVSALNIGGYGESPLFYAQGRDPIPIMPMVPGPLIGLQSFSLRAVVPEPSTWVLLALGGLALAWAPRRRRRLTTDKPTCRW